MTTITRISKDKGEFYLLWLSSGEKLRVSEDILVRQRLLKGQELSDTLIEEIKKASSYDVGLQMAMNYLSYQLRSKKEIFSESYVRTAMRTSDKGPRNVAQQLKQKGISEEDIQHGLTFYTLDEQLNVATATAEKAMKRYRTKSFKDALQKTRLHLMQKGFTNEIIDLALESLAFEKDEEQEQQALNKEGERLWRANQRFDFSKKVQKVKQSLFQKGFDYDLIQQFISEKEVEHDE